MNFKQLERMRLCLRNLRIVLEEDSEGTADINRALDELEFQVDKELKELLWLDYLEEQS